VVEDSSGQGLWRGEPVALQRDLALKSVVAKLGTEDSSERERPVSTKVNLKR
jgi:hypothetical protein